MMLEDTTMPPMLDQTGQMGMDSFVDTTPDYSGVGTANPIAQNRGATEMGTRPPDFVAGAQTFTDPEPSARLDARGTTITGTTPPDTIGPQPVNIVERETTHPIVEMRGDITPAVETVPGLSLIHI